MTIARWLETDSLSNQDISSATAIGAYTADADRMVVVDVSLDAVAGNGDYVIYVTRQINGAGSAYVLLPKTTCTAASGETAIAMQSGPITLRSGDVLTVYVDGLAGDTTTPDTTVRWFEMAALQPTDAGRTLDIAATGEASANVTLQAGVAVAPADANGNVPVVLYGTQPAVIFGKITLDSGGYQPALVLLSPLSAAISGATGLTVGLTSAGAAQVTAAVPDAQDIADALLLAPSGAAASGSAMDYLADILEDTGTTLPGLIAAGTGSGAVSFPVTINDEDSNPIDGVEVWVSTDSAGASVVAGTLSTDALGVATFMLDAGTYYLWRQKSGYNFTNPVTIVVS